MLVLAEGFVASELLSVKAFTVTVYVPGAVPFALPPRCVFAVVVTVTVAVSVLVLLKFSVYLFNGSEVVVTRQLAFGAVVAHENATRPVPVVLFTVIVVLLPVVAPAFTAMFPAGVICGVGIGEGVYCRT